MKTKKVKTVDGDTITRKIPETPEERDQLHSDLGADAGRHSFGDGRKEPLDVDEFEGDPDLGEIRSAK